ncbi:MAG TPA: hypothetical protein VIL99_16845 [Ignavibacteria bacterium]
MPLISTSDLYKIAEEEIPYRLSTIFDDSYMQKTASKRLNESRQLFSYSKKYDIFLSHSYDDAKAIYGLKIKLERLKYSVFVDWNEEEFSDRENVDTERANELRIQMNSCKILIFVTSENSSESVWMPWELGYFDGYKGKVAIMPLNEETTPKNEYIGQEYLGIYPYIKDYSGDLVMIYNDNRIVRLQNWIL